MKSQVQGTTASVPRARVGGRISVYETAVKCALRDDLRDEWKRTSSRRATMSAFS